MSFVTILGSIATIIYPTSCFVKDILVNIHTMWLHFGSFVVSIYLIMSGEIVPNRINYRSSILVFFVFVIAAQILNITVYNSGVLNEETFNMFYISPYFTSSLPVFDILQENVPYIVFLIIYVLAICLGAYVVWYISSKIRNLKGGNL